MILLMFNDLGLMFHRLPRVKDHLLYFSDISYEMVSVTPLNKSGKLTLIHSRVDFFIEEALGSSVSSANLKI